MNDFYWIIRISLEEEGREIRGGSSLERGDCIDICVVVVGTNIIIFVPLNVREGVEEG